MSTIVATKRALVSTLSARLTPVQVTYGDDVRRPQRERVYMGDVEEHESEPATMRSARVRTEESYSVRLFVLVDSTKGHEATEVRALEILGEVQDLLTGDPKLATAEDPPGILWATFGGFTLSTSIVAEGTHRTIIEADVAVRARNA